MFIYLRHKPSNDPASGAFLAKPLNDLISPLIGVSRFAPKGFNIPSEDGRSIEPVTEVASRTE
jgi:hypothetical protein